MASIAAILSFLIMACTALAAMMPINQGCATSSPSVKVLTYTQWTAPQIGKTSTVYDMIVTHYDYIIWCSNGRATVTNVPPTATSSGPFTAQVRSSALTVEEVRCIQADMVLTRREVRGNEHVKKTAIRREIDAPTTTTLESPSPTHLQSYPHVVGLSIPIPKGWSWKHKDTTYQPQAARQITDRRQDASTTVPTTLSPQAAALVSELQTAQYALELCNDNFNLTLICNALRDPAAIIPLANVGVSASQAGDIVCWAAVYGIDFNTTNAALLGNLAAAVYGLELGDNFTATANTTKLCDSIDLHLAPYLGINAGAVNSFICGGPSSSVTFTAVTTQTVLVIPGSPTVTYTASGAGANSGGPTTILTASGIGTNSSGPTTTLTASGVGATDGQPWQSGMGTGDPNGYSNGTFAQPTGGSAVSGGAAPTGVGNPWGNSTGTDSLGVEFPGPSDMAPGQDQKTPMAPDVAQYYPASSMETVTASYGRYE